MTARRLLQGIAVVVPAVEVVVLLRAGLDPSGAVLATAPGPLPLLHDLRWLLALPLPAWGFLLAAGAVLALRAGWLVLAALAVGRHPDARAVLRATALAGALLTPVAVLLVGMAGSGVPYLLWAAVPVGLVVLLAVAPPLAEAAGRDGRAARRRVLPAAALLTVAGAVTGVVPTPAAPAVAAAAGLLSARLLLGHAPLAGDAAPRRRSALVPAVAGTAAVAVLVGTTYAGLAPAGATTAGAAVHYPTHGSGRPVLVVDGFNSAFRAAPALDPERPVWGFSYRGLADDGTVRPHLPEDTLAGVDAAVTALADQVEALAAAYQAPVSLVGISQGALVARTYLAGHPGAPVDRVVLVDLPVRARGLRWPEAAGLGAGFATGWALRAVSAAVEGLTPIHVAADSPLAREMTGCGLPADDVPLAVPEVRLQSLTDAVAGQPAAPPGVPVVAHVGAHALSLRWPASRAAIGQALAGDLAPSAPTELLTRVLERAAAPWRQPSRPACAGVS